MRFSPKYRLLPTPYSSVLLFIVWLLLNQSVAVVHVFFGFILAIGIPLITNRLRDPQPLIMRPVLALKYLIMVFADIVKANGQVFWLILGSNKKLTPAFIKVPLDLEHALPLTILASTVSLTPGTVSAEIYPSLENLAPGEVIPKRWLLIHVLSLAGSEDELIDEIKMRYEAPLKDIFQC